METHSQPGESKLQPERKRSPKSKRTFYSFLYFSAAQTITYARRRRRLHYRTAPSSILRKTRKTISSPNSLTSNMLRALAGRRTNTNSSNDFRQCYSAAAAREVPVNSQKWNQKLNLLVSIRLAPLASFVRLFYEAPEATAMSARPPREKSPA